MVVSMTRSAALCERVAGVRRVATWSEGARFVATRSALTSPSCGPRPALLERCLVNAEIRGCLLALPSRIGVSSIRLCDSQAVPDALLGHRLLAGHDLKGTTEPMIAPVPLGSLSITRWWTVDRSGLRHPRSREPAPCAPPAACSVAPLRGMIARFELAVAEMRMPLRGWMR